MKPIGRMRPRAVHNRWITARVLVALCCLAGGILVPAQLASAATQGEAIVAAAASMAGVPYCEPGGITASNAFGPGPSSAASNGVATTGSSVPASAGRTTGSTSRPMEMAARRRAGGSAWCRSSAASA